MSDEAFGDLLRTCESSIHSLRRLTERIDEPDVRPDILSVALTAELDRLAAAVRQARRADWLRHHGGDPGE